MSVVQFPMPQHSALEIIKNLANTDRALIPPRLAADDWPHVQLRRQVIRCLEDGEITGGPETNEFGHWEYQMMRVSAGQEIYLTAVLYQDEGDGEWTVFVKEVTNGEY